MYLNTYLVNKLILDMAIYNRLVIYNTIKLIQIIEMVFILL